MVILIGGSSHVGKTYLSQKLMEKFQIPYVCEDHIKMGLIRTKTTSITVEEDDKMRVYLWPIVAEMIKTVIENDQNVIIEGCYIPKNWKESFSEDYLKEIHPLFLVMDELYIRTHFADIQNKANVIEHRLPEKLDLERLVFCSKMFKEHCIENGTPYLEISGSYDINQILEEAITLLRLAK